MLHAAAGAATIYHRLGWRAVPMPVQSFPIRHLPPPPPCPPQHFQHTEGSIDPMGNLAAPTSDAEDSQQHSVFLYGRTTKTDCVVDGCVVREIGWSRKEWDMAIARLAPLQSKFIRSAGVHGAHVRSRAYLPPATKSLSREESSTSPI